MDDVKQTTRRFAIIGALVLSMLVPLAMVGGVTDERQSYFDQTFQDIAGAWGGAQNIVGPVLIIPELHTRTSISESGEQVSETWRRHNVILPDELKLEIDIDHQLRHRAIYEVPVFLADLRVTGVFESPTALQQHGSDMRVLIEEAFIAIGVSHPQAISQASAFTVGDTEVNFSSGSGTGWLGSGINVGLSEMKLDEPLSFSFNLRIKGTEHLAVMPVGNDNDIIIRSTWPHPSFSGTYLPEHHEIEGDGFEAVWRVHELARELPSTWYSDMYTPDRGTGFARVGLFQPVTDYRTVDRAIKYGLLFVALTYLSFICFELTQPVRFHPVQYGVVGVGLSLFYLALLSLSEHISFGWAFLLATMLLTVLIAGYVRAMTARVSLMVWSGCIMVTLYGTLYVLLQLETFALLVGTSVLIVGLIALMYVTRSLGGELRHSRDVVT